MSPIAISTMSDPNFSSKRPAASPIIADAGSGSPRVELSAGVVGVVVVVVVIGGA